MNSRSESNFRNTVTCFSFILTVLVIYIHSPNLTGQALAQPGGGFCGAAENLIVSIGQIAVPGFFMLSGCLFFRRKPGEGFDRGTDFFVRQFRKKLFTLLVPYLLWNIFYSLVYFVFLREPVTVASVLEGVFFYKYNPVFWYMKQLIILTALTPVICLLLWNRFAAVPVLAGLYLLAVNYRILPVHPVNEDALFYFSAGAWVALQHPEWLDTGKNTGRLKAAAAGIVIVCICVLFRERAGLYAVIMLRAAAPAVLFTVLSLLGAGNSEPPAFMRINFFIYAFHFLIVRASTRLVKLLFGENPAALLTVFLVMPVLAVGISWLTACLLRKYLKPLWRLITGGR